MVKSNISPLQEQELPDSALSILEMLEGKILDYCNTPILEGREREDKIKEFEGLFKQNVLDKAELAKQIVLIDSMTNMLNEITKTPEQRMVNYVDYLISKMTDSNYADLDKTNLPPVPVKEEDSVSELSDKERTTIDSAKKVDDDKDDDKESK